MRKNFIHFSLGLVFFIGLPIYCETAIGGDAPQVTTDKDIYNYGETIKVTFFNSPGKEDDWICIVPAGSPDTEGGDYKYMPKGLAQGSLIFDLPSPGKYEVRAYYNYGRNGYVVSDRYAFSVVSSPEGEAAMAQRMERQIDPNNTLEASIPPGNGLVYIFREPLYALSSFEVPIKANEKPIVVIGNSSYYAYSVPAGDVKFTTGGIRNTLQRNIGEGVSVREGEVTITVKPGYTYYLRLRLIPVVVAWNIYLEHVAHQEGASLIKNYKLTQLIE